MLVRDHPEFTVFRFRLAISLGNLAARQYGVGHPDARPLVERALAIHEALARELPADVINVSALVDRASQLATAQAVGGRRDEAQASIRRAEKALERSPDVAPSTLYNLACAYARCAAADRRERGTGTEHADRAMAVLRRSVAAGFSDVPLIRRDADLDSLRDRLDFQELLMDLSFPADPFQQ